MIDRGLQPDTKTTWTSLMAAAQSGDRRAYRQLLHEITPYVSAIVRRLHAHPDRVDDIVQDVLLCIHRVRHTYDPARPFVHWLGTIAHRRSVDSLRRHRRIDTAEVKNDDFYETFADPGANDVVEEREHHAMLRDAIRDLPPGQRQAVELLKLRELSLAEASGISGQSIGALKVSLHRAVKALKALLAGKVDGHG